MSLTALLVTGGGILAAGWGIGRFADTAVARWISALALVAGIVAGIAIGRSGLVPVPIGPPLVGLLGLGALLSRPPAWRSPRGLAQLVETVLLVELVFLAQDLKAVVVLWLLSLVPGLATRERAGISRRPLGLLAAAVLASVGVGLTAFALLDEAGGHTVLYLALVVAAAIRMGVPPFSPLLLASYERLPFGRAALVGALRPSVLLILVARQDLSSAAMSSAEWLQAWAALAAVAAALQGVVATGLRRRVGCLSTTQSSIILYGLVSPGTVGTLGALVQWAGLGLSLVGLGMIVEAIEGRLGERRAARASGLQARAPGMAFLFLLFAATMSGFPGTTGFAGEDLVTQAPAAHPTVMRALLLAATALNGMTMLGLFARSFLGPIRPAEVEEFPPLTLRERLVLGGVAVALLALTVSPNLVTS